MTQTPNDLPEQELVPADGEEDGARPHGDPVIDHGLLTSEEDDDQSGSPV